MLVGILGSGDVAKSLAKGFIDHGHGVMLGTRTASNLDAWVKQHASAKIGSFADAAKFGEVIVLAVRGTTVQAALRAVNAADLGGKTIIDATNPIAHEPPTNGVLRYTTGLNESSMENLQREFADANFVKAFNSVGSACMVNPTFSGGKPSMFICGNSDAAKRTVSDILEQFGWEVADMGGVQSARAIEPLGMLWCIPGFLRNDWTHAFKLLS